MNYLTPFYSRRGLSGSLFDDMDRFFNDALSFNTMDEATFNPAVEITETDDHFLMSVDLPGMKRDQIHVDMHGNTLTISGERQREFKSDSKDRVQRVERTYGSFRRSFTLPTSIDAQKIEAHYEDGVLELSLPKSEAAKPRNIEIQSGRGGLFSKLLGQKRQESASGKTEVPVSGKEARH